MADAIKTAEARKKEVVLEGKDEVHRFRNESEKEISDRGKEVQRHERRIQQMEETLDKLLDNIEILWYTDIGQQCRSHWKKGGLCYVL